MPSSRSKLTRPSRRLAAAVALVLSLVVACAIPGAAAAKPAYGGTAPEAGS